VHLAYPHFELLTGEKGGYHNASGYPIVRTDKYPDLAGLVAYAKQRNVSIGWYLNCDGCKEGVW
jgi:hypothetical protein